MPAAPSRRALVLTAAAIFAATTGVLARYGAPDTGFGRLFYFGIVVFAFATGPRLGALAGAVAAAFYALAVLVNPRLPLTELSSSEHVIRSLSYVGIGALVGWFAATSRDLTDRLQLLAKVDPVTGLANLRAFEEMITRNLADGARFVLFIAECGADASGEVVEAQAQVVGNQLLREAGQQAEVARTGASEFAIVVPGTPQPAATATQLERLLAAAGACADVGWAVHPADGTTALALHRVAVERAYVRRLFARPDAAALRT
jgi:predicted signal transduction protein with EAL and GGDEF domain